jgi:hypothetical protein
MEGYFCGRFFYSIDGNVIKASQAVGYCTYKQGMLSKAQCDTHNCKCKSNGGPCRRFIEFEYEDRNDDSMPIPTGEAYQEWLKNKRKR